MTDDSNTEGEDRKRLVSLITQHQRRIFSYIYTMVPRRQEAEDLLQETSVVICEKFDDFTEGTDFVAWACQIAYWRVRYSRQKYARSKVLFNQEVLDVVAKTAEDMTVELDERHIALSNCLEKLHTRDREFIMTRYEPGGGVEEAARKAGRSITAAYKALTRIRKLLLDCVTEQLARESAS
ncbi:sigma-70 family RNA polymerase sigma factor [Bythopirellula polymerisocia]|uniref:RNA polymerase sigma factor n=1 Tax=Bythopirellula polymerisocia TaxID=2528003 RepID=A0A5C6CBY8_9BACT|nr:sigma-70 family RNA polymerase sigma factor [Bythopirellula polymerisocia]TWU20349.1 RNA polymerase sigma factor [Bythopirellula polymerisocia]